MPHVFRCGHLWIGVLFGWTRILAGYGVGRLRLEGHRRGGLDCLGASMVVVYSRQKNAAVMKVN